ncbi:hypothetical protein [Burkholderia pseudomallei]
MARAEHRPFVQGAAWSVNSFDKWSVAFTETLTRKCYSAMCRTLL